MPLCGEEESPYRGEEWTAERSAGEAFRGDDWEIVVNAIAGVAAGDGVPEAVAVAEAVAIPPADWPLFDDNLRFAVRMVEEMRQNPGIIGLVRAFAIDVIEGDDDSDQARN